MLPPVLEIFVIWHPGDAEGRSIAEELVAHFRGVSFSGVVGGGIHVALRSEGWHEQGGAPQPVYTQRSPGPNGIQPAKYVAVVPLLGVELAGSVEEGTSWRAFVEELVAEETAASNQIGIFPYLLDRNATDQTYLGTLFNRYQRIATGDPSKAGDNAATLRCRDLSQALAQMLASGSEDRLKVFVSHTKRSSDDEGPDVDDLVELVRTCIGSTHLSEFFDASDLQPGKDWEKDLRENSARSALLAIRTDLYASREWCQREVAIAKCAGMPVVTLDAIGRGEERGSFLMDHVPRVPVRKGQEHWSQQDVMRALNVLTDECLKRAIWLRQQEITDSEGGMGISWWAPQAPEPLTLLDWIEQESGMAQTPESSETLRVLHPDPPLGPEERNVLSRLAKMSKLGRDIDIMTPRLLAARGG